MTPTSNRTAARGAGIAAGAFRSSRREEIIANLSRRRRGCWDIDVALPHYLQHLTSGAEPAAVTDFLDLAAVDQPVPSGGFGTEGKRRAEFRLRPLSDR